MLLNRDLLQSVRTAATSDDTRYCLDAVQVQPDGTCVATNGHILIIGKETSPLSSADYPTIAGVPAECHEPTGPVMIPSAIVDRLIKGTPKRPTIPVLASVSVSSNGDGSSYAVSTDLQLPVVAKITPDGSTFPAIDRVIPPADRPVLTICLGVPVLEVLIKSAKAVHASAIRFDLPTEAKHQGRGEKDPNGEHKGDGVIQTAITAMYGSDIKVKAVLMPVRM